MLACCATTAAADPLRLRGDAFATTQSPAGLLTLQATGERDSNLSAEAVVWMGESTGEKGEPQLVIRCAFADFGQMQKALEDRGITPLSAESEYLPLTPIELPEAQATEVLSLIDRLEQDDDVQRVFHNLG